MKDDFLSHNSQSLSLSPNVFKPFVVEEKSSADCPIVCSVVITAHQYRRDLLLDGVVVEVRQVEPRVGPVLTRLAEEAGGHYNEDLCEVWTPHTHL